MPKKNAQNVRIRLKSYDYKLLDQAAMHIAESAKRQGLEIRGPFPLPTTTKKWTVLRGPHVNKSLVSNLSVEHTIDFLTFLTFLHLRLCRV